MEGGRSGRRNDDDDACREMEDDMTTTQFSCMISP